MSDEVTTARARLFGLKPVITVVHDITLDSDLLDVQRLLAHMTDRPAVATHEIPCLIAETRDWVIEQYPQLVDVDVDRLKTLLDASRLIGQELLDLDMENHLPVESEIVAEWLRFEALRLGRDTLMIEPMAVQAAWRIAEHCGDLSILTRIPDVPSSN